MINMTCPCQGQHANAALYNECCQVFHLGALAPTAEKLMRSRYSAYVLGFHKYLKATWHSTTCPNPLEAEADDQWLKLDIISFTESGVHFKAYFKEENTFKYLEESSVFVKENNRLVYLNGETRVGDASLSRNDICLCGSGKKFKKCCANI